MRFRARMDGFVTGVTIFVLALMGAALVGIFMAGAGLASVAAAVAVGAIVIFAYVYTPKAFHVEGDVLRIERTASDVRIPLAAITEVALVDEFLGLSIKAPPRRQ